MHWSDSHFLKLNVSMNSWMVCSSCAVICSIRKVNARSCTRSPGGLIDKTIRLRHLNVFFYQVVQECCLYVHLVHCDRVLGSITYQNLKDVNLVSEAKIFRSISHDWFSLTRNTYMFVFHLSSCDSGTRSYVMFV